ncbi:MAG: helix-hairpin-helix domain-containing protein [Acidovorax sp.]|nr:helix-hairpin-helix domain-containing protein [Acidovorax sp.]
MRFSPSDRHVLLAVNGVGLTVLARLEAMGFHSLDQLADADAADILRQGALLTGSSCWKNSPQARSAIDGAIAAAVAQVSGNAVT